MATGITSMLRSSETPEITSRSFSLAKVGINDDARELILHTFKVISPVIESKKLWNTLNTAAFNPHLDMLLTSVPIVLPSRVRVLISNKPLQAVSDAVFG